MWLPPALGMPVAMLWEQKGEKGPLGEPSTETGMASQPDARKISGCFRMSKLSIPATPGCSAVLPPPLSAAAIQGVLQPHSPFPTGDGRSRTKSHPASAGHYHPVLHPTCPSGAAVAVAVAVVAVVAVAVAWQWQWHGRREQAS